MKSIRLIVTAVLATIVAVAAQANNLESVMNAFLAKFAKTNIAWKKDIVLTSTPDDIPPGAQLGLSRTVGYYHFVPKLWSDLSPDEKQDVLQDKRLASFIISLRDAAAPAADGEGRRVVGPNGRPMFPVEGLSLRDVAVNSAAAQRALRVASFDLKGEDIVSTKDVILEVLR